MSSKINQMHRQKSHGFSSMIQSTSKLKSKIENSLKQGNRSFANAKGQRASRRSKGGERM